MEKKIVEMSISEYKRFLAFKKADKIARSLKRSLLEVHSARLENRPLKSARALAYEL